MSLPGKSLRRALFQRALGDMVEYKNPLRAIIYVEKVKLTQQIKNLHQQNKNEYDALKLLIIIKSIYSLKNFLQ